MTTSETSQWRCNQISNAVQLRPTQLIRNKNIISQRKMIFDSLISHSIEYVNCLLSSIISASVFCSGNYGSYSEVACTLSVQIWCVQVYRDRRLLKKNGIATINISFILRKQLPCYIFCMFELCSATCLLLLSLRVCCPLSVA